MTTTLYASTFQHDMWKGNKRYLAIVVYDTLEQFHKACEKHSHNDPNDGWKDAAAGFFPASVYDKEQKEWVVSDNEQFIGTMRFAKGWINDMIVIHECLHAAAHLYRLQINENLYIGRGHSKADSVREENLAYMMGDIGAEVAGTLARAGLFNA